MHPICHKDQEPKEALPFSPFVSAAPTCSARCMQFHGSRLMAGVGVGVWPRCANVLIPCGPTGGPLIASTATSHWQP